MLVESGGTIKSISLFRQLVTKLFGLSFSTTILMPPKIGYNQFFRCLYDYLLDRIRRTVLQKIEQKFAKSSYSISSSGFCRFSPELLFMDMSQETKRLKKSAFSRSLSIKHLPTFPDENTPLQWIWPPYAGRKILHQIFKHALRPHLQPDGTWIIKAKNYWYCYSKSQWLYSDEKIAREVLRANMRMHLQCSPILSEQRCVVLTPDFNDQWRLWQIVHIEPTLADYLTKILQGEQFDKLALKIFGCANYYANALQQSIKYPPLLNMTLDNLGLNTGQQVFYLGCLDENNPNIIQPSREILLEMIKSVFTVPISEALPHLEVTTVVKDLKNINYSKQRYLKEILVQLFNSN